MVEPVALGDRARELVAVDHLVVAKQRLGRLAGHPRFVHHLVDPLAARVPEVDDDVGDEHPRVAALHRRRNAVAGLRLALELPSRRFVPGGDRSQVSGSVFVCHVSERTARLITSIGGSRPVQIRSEAAPWRTSTSSPSTTRARRALAARTSSVSTAP